MLGICIARCFHAGGGRSSSAQNYRRIAGTELCVCEEWREQKLAEGE